VATRLREALRAYIREYVAKAQRQAVAQCPVSDNY
jgi:hypothetical protein